MTPDLPHISVCICTYRRGDYLSYLLAELSKQETGGLFTYSVVVVDNDRCRSAEPIVAASAETSPVAVQYLVEPRQNIALARNMAIRNGNGEFIAFIDDDEFPTSQWLKTLFTECEKRNVDGVLGPVKPHYEIQPPRWVVVAGFYDRPSYPTGLVIDGSKGRTGNVLFKKAVIDGESELFRPEFRSGEDQDFFRRMISKGHVFTWCNEAMVHEWVPQNRWSRTFLLKRALLRGAMSALHPNAGIKDAFKSILVIAAYIAVLPFALLISQGKFMLYFVSMFDHVGKVAALLGFNLVSKQYITE